MNIIMAEDIFESIDHCANRAIPITVNTEVMKVKRFDCSIPQIAINTIRRVIKMNKFKNFNIGLILYFEYLYLS